ncbi:MAG: SUMF1/EgtB/PvdO family nonheme iron enzyme, partial [Chloroflexota bacterium]
DDTYYASLEDGVVDPPGPAEGTLRVVRGGSWSDPAALMQSAARAHRNPDDGYATVGFRVVLPVDPAPGGPAVDLTEEAVG